MDKIEFKPFTLNVEDCDLENIQDLVDLDEEAVSLFIYAAIKHLDETGESKILFLILETEDNGFIDIFITPNDIESTIDCIITNLSKYEHYEECDYLFKLKKKYENKFDRKQPSRAGKQQLPEQTEA